MYNAEIQRTRMVTPPELLIINFDGYGIRYANSAYWYRVMKISAWRQWPRV